MQKGATMSNGGTFGGAPFDVAMRATLGDLLGGAKERTMRTRDEIDGILAARCAAMDATNGAHDAKVAARLIADGADVTAAVWEIRVHARHASREYLVAYVDTMLAAVRA